MFIETCEDLLGKMEGMVHRQYLEEELKKEGN